MKTILILFLSITLLSTDAVRRPAFSDKGLFEDLTEELVIGSIVPIGLSGVITLVNRDLLKNNEGSAGLGLLGVCVGGLTTLLGAIIIYSDIYSDSEATISGWSLAGLGVGLVGTMSVVYGIKSISVSSRRSETFGSNRSDISPVVFRVDGQFNVGAQLTIRF